MELVRDIRGFLVFRIPPCAADVAILHLVIEGLAYELRSQLRIRAFLVVHVREESRICSGLLRALDSGSPHDIGRGNVVHSPEQFRLAADFELLGLDDVLGVVQRRLPVASRECDTNLDGTRHIEFYVGLVACQSRLLSPAEEDNRGIEVVVYLLEHHVELLPLLPDEVLVGRLGVNRHAGILPAVLVLQGAVRRARKPIGEVEIGQTPDCVGTAEHIVPVNSRTGHVVLRGKHCVHVRDPCVVRVPHVV